MTDMVEHVLQGSPSRGEARERIEDRASGVRFSELDAARGLAAFSVVLFHCYTWFPFLKDYAFWVDYTPVSRLLYGRFAVLFFFVLSGFVLSQPLLRDTRSGYRQYLIRRICRIYVPFLASIAVAGLLAASFELPLAQSHDPNFWSRPVSWSLLLQHAAMVGVGSDTVTLNPPMWSLIQELRISFFFPLLFALAFRLGWVAVILNVIVSIAALKVAAHFAGFKLALYGETWPGTVLVTLYYTQYFTLGCMLAIKREQVSAAFGRVPPVLHLLIVAVLLGVPWRFLDEHFHVGDVFCGMAAAYIIVASITTDAVRAVLSWSALQWLGRVSFSLYLVHVPILLAAYGALQGRVSDLVICVVVIALSLLASQAFNVLVERPSIRLGRLLAR